MFQEVKYAYRKEDNPYNSQNMQAPEGKYESGATFALFGKAKN